MVLPQHTDWAKPEPGYKGTYNYIMDAYPITIPVAGTIDVELPGGNLNFLYILLLTNPSSNAWQFTLYDEVSRASGDLVFQTPMTVGDYSSITSSTGLIVLPDRNGTSYLHARVTGTPGDILTVNGRNVRVR